MTRSGLTPTTEEVEALRNQVGPGPVVMLNLLKFREPGGREAFGAYGAMTGPLIARQGGEVMYVGEVGPSLVGEDWDTLILVRFPSIEAFIGLAGDAEYQERAPALRDAALERTTWTVTRPAGV
jgi:uncharacterized protein (DUF1330 family)